MHTRVYIIIHNERSHKKYMWHDNLYIMAIKLKKCKIILHLILILPVSEVFLLDDILIIKCLPFNNMLLLRIPQMFSSETSTYYLLSRVNDVHIQITYNSLQVQVLFVLYILLFLQFFHLYSSCSSKFQEPNTNTIKRVYCQNNSCCQFSLCNSKNSK